MNKIAGFLFSARFMAVLLALFATSIAIATFIENDFGSLAARALVYNARWFEILLFIGCINLLGRVLIRRLYSRDKMAIFLFHIAFVIIMAGASITRYTGWEGTMSIREGDSENRVLTDKTYIRVESDKTYNFRVTYNSFLKSRLRKEFLHRQTPFKIRMTGFIPNAYEFAEAFENGGPVAEFIYSDSTGRNSLVIEKGDNKFAGALNINFTDSSSSEGISLVSKNDSLFFSSPFSVTVSSMDGSSFRQLQPGILHNFVVHQIYSFNGQNLVLNAYYPSGRITARSLPTERGQTYDAVVIRVSSDNYSKELILLGKAGYPAIPKKVNINGKDITFSYGSSFRELPFDLRLDDFIIERYPGSHSPSSFESKIFLIDPSTQFSASYRIYMNNILKYKGYRFYQSSFDADERGTILSVNHDQAGTSVTYAGYLLLGVCMIISLFHSKSRFRFLSKDIAHLKTLKNSVKIIVFLIFTSSAGSLAQSSADNPVVSPDKTHADRFGHLLVQDNSGRVEPVNTLSSEVLRKLMRSDNYKGMNSEQVFLGMMTDPYRWQFEPLIKSSHPEIMELLGTREKYHAFASFFNNQNYILESRVSAAYRKKPAARSRLDNEIIKLDEKINICYLVFTGEFLKVFPVPGDSTHTWYSPRAIYGKVQTADSVFTNNAFMLYSSEVQNASHTGNWKPADDLLNAITAYQQRFSGEIIPPKKKVNAEIFLNKYDPFSGISKYYGIIGFVLLILQLIALFLPRVKLSIPVTICLMLIIMIFAIHTIGLGLRWYVSGHAPWSNGYEALTYISWAAALAGLLFSFKSPLTPGVGSILAFLTLFVAHLSWMDPQITNLVPVLKSYWLVIHVATITASYGFLAMGALLAFMNMIIMILHSSGNRLYLRYTVQEITHTIEMSLTIGLYLLTIGVFLGAVWANESWGRYWGWDPKETWALVTVIVYAFVLHMRMVPGLKGCYAFNLGSLLAFSSVIMTYFGVNYYLSGLHSYAKGDPLPVPLFVYYTVAVIFMVAIMARIRSVKLEPDQCNAEEVDH